MKKFNVSHNTYKNFKEIEKLPSHSRDFSRELDDSVF